MSKSAIPQKVQSALWARAGGRCQYRGCNSDLIGDLISGRQDGIYGFIAHIVADTDTGPRGDPTRSPLLCRAIENLMIMCARHHKLIDVDSVVDHSEATLLSMKAQHEARIASVVCIDHDRASHVVRYAANIGENEALISTRDIFSSMLPDHYPEAGNTIDIEMIGSSFKDNEASYWEIQRENLRRQFEAKIRGRIERQEIRHLSIFALAPQPLLIELGRLLGDIVPTCIHQRHREPPTWKWQGSQPILRLTTSEPSTKNSDAIALKLGVSATITDDRIHAALGENAEIWSLHADDPHNDIVRSPEDLVSFRKVLRKLYNRIKAAHGAGVKLHVFPALPVSLAVEVGRVWMPKSDLPLVIYDNFKLAGFSPAFEIS